MIMSQYVTIPSNTPFDGNTMSKFTIQLSRTIIFEEDDWEVGMTSISYPINWPHYVPSGGEQTLHCMFHNAEGGGSDYYVDMEMPRGQDVTLGDYIFNMQSAIMKGANQYVPVDEINDYTEGVNYPAWTFDDGQTAQDKDRKVLVCDKQTGVWIAVPLAKQLGLIKDQPMEEFQTRYPYVWNDLVELNTTHIKSSPFPKILAKPNLDSSQEEKLILGDDLYTLQQYKKWYRLLKPLTQPIPPPFNTIYVYSDVVASSIVGNAHVNVLRAIHPRGREGYVHHFEPQRINYLPIRKKVFNTITIQLADDQGKPINFTSGVVVVELHFSRRSARPEQ